MCALVCDLALCYHLLELLEGRETASVGPAQQTSVQVATASLRQDALPSGAARGRAAAAGLRRSQAAARLGRRGSRLTRCPQSAAEGPLPEGVAQPLSPPNLPPAPLGRTAKPRQRDAPLRAVPPERARGSRACVGQGRRRLRAGPGRVGQGRAEPWLRRPRLR